MLGMEKNVGTKCHQFVLRLKMHLPELSLIVCHVTELFSVNDICY